MIHFTTHNLTTLSMRKSYIMQISGLAIAFEAVFNVRIRDDSGATVVEKFFSAAGASMWRNFQITLPLTKVPTTPSGTLEVFSISAKDGREVDKVVIPIVFGTALVNPYHGFYQHEVKHGETLYAIAKQAYNHGKLSDRIFEANRDQLVSPNKISPGQCLRIPM